MKLMSIRLLNKDERAGLGVPDGAQAYGVYAPCKCACLVAASTTLNSACDFAVVQYNGFIESMFAEIAPDALRN